MLMMAVVRLSLKPYRLAARLTNHTVSGRSLRRLLDFFTQTKLISEWCTETVLIISPSCCILQELEVRGRAAQCPTVLFNCRCRVLELSITSTLELVN